MVGVGPSLIGVTPFTAASPGILTPFTLAMPTGTLVGDLQIASILTQQETLVDPSGGFTRLWRSDVDGHRYGIWDYGVWVRYWDGDTTPISWTGGGTDTARGQFFGAYLATFRNRRDESRPFTLTDGPTVPGLPYRGPALCLTWLRSPGSDTVDTIHPFIGTDWTETHRVEGSFVLGSIAVHADEVAAQTSSLADTNPYMAFGMTGIILAPPCRLHPREDQLGVGSGRIWPPPKSHQASPRRAGSYY